MRKLLFFWMIFLSNALWAADSVASFPVYLYKSPLTAEFFRVNGASYDKLLGAWGNYFNFDEDLYKEIGRKELLGSLKAPGLLILSSALLMDEQERLAVDRFAAQGGSVLATWGTGIRDQMGKWRGYDFLESTFGVRVQGQINRRSKSWFLMPFGDSPLNTALPAGQRMYLGKTAEELIRVESPHLAAVYMDWSRGKDEEGASGAIAFQEVGASRRVYMGFSESTWFFVEPTHLKSILDGVLSWLKREPKAFKAAWPNGHVAAHLFEMDTEDKFFSATSFADHLEKIGVKGTFYCLTSLAVQYPEIVKDLLRRGHEIAYHADVHFGFRADKPAVQEKRLLNMKTQMQTILGNKLDVVTGFRAPTESYDPTTEQLLRKHGMLHHAADPASTESRLPFFSKSSPEATPDDALVVLPRTQHDDVNFRRFNYSAPKTAEILEHDLDMVVRSGALGLLSVHSQNYVPGGLMLATIPRLMDRVAQLEGKLWVARGDQIADWWRQRERVTVTHMPKATGTRALQVAVKPPGAVSGLTVFVVLPRQNAQVQIKALGESKRKFSVQAVDPFRVAIVFERLEAGTSDYELVFQ